MNDSLNRVGPLEVGGLQIFDHSDEELFPTFERDDPPDLIVIHETVGFTIGGMIDTLRYKKCGIHFAIDHDGATHQFVPADRWTPHAPGVNKRSIGIEIVNPYHGSMYSKRRAFDPQLSENVFAHKLLANPPSWYFKTQAERSGEYEPAYVLPTDEQVEASLKLVSVLLMSNHSIPVDFPLYDTPYAVRKPPSGGIIAHGQQNANRADGFYIVEQLIYMMPDAADCGAAVNNVEIDLEDCTAEDVLPGGEPL